MESKSAAEASQRSIAGWFAEVFGQCTKAPAVDGELMFDGADKKEKKGKKEKKSKAGKKEQAVGSKGGTGAALAVSGSAAFPGAVSRYMVDNSILQAENRPGVAFRKSKREADKVRSELPPARWGEIVKGIDEGDGWLKVGDFFLPMVLQGKPVLTLAKEAESPPGTEAVGASSGASVVAAPLARSSPSGESAPPKKECTSTEQGGQEEGLSLLRKEAQEPESSTAEREEELGTNTNKREVQAPEEDATTVQRISVQFGPRILQVAASGCNADMVVEERQMGIEEIASSRFQVAASSCNADMAVEERQMGIEEMVSSGCQVAASGCNADMAVEERQMGIEEMASSGCQVAASGCNADMSVEEKQMGIEEMASSGCLVAASGCNADMIVEEKQMEVEEMASSSCMVAASGCNADMTVEEKQMGIEEMASSGCQVAASGCNADMIVEEKQMEVEEVPQAACVPADAVQRVVIHFGPRVLGRHARAEAAEVRVPADAALPVPIRFGPRVLGRQACAEYYDSIAVEQAVC